MWQEWYFSSVVVVVVVVAFVESRNENVVAWFFWTTIRGNRDRKPDDEWRLLLLLYDDFYDTNHNLLLPQQRFDKTTTIFLYRNRKSILSQKWTATMQFPRESSIVHTRVHPSHQRNATVHSIVITRCNYYYDRMIHSFSFVIQRDTCTYKLLPEPYQRRHSK